MSHRQQSHETTSIRSSRAYSLQLGVDGERAVYTLLDQYSTVGTSTAHVLNDVLEGVVVGRARNDTRASSDSAPLGLVRTVVAGLASYVLVLSSLQRQRRRESEGLRIGARGLHSLSYRRAP